MGIRARDIILGTVAAVAIAAAVYSWYRPPKTLLKTQYVEVPKEKIVEKIRTIKVPGPKEIVTIEKEQLTKEVGATFEENEQPIANADVPASEGGVSVIATMDTTTGETKIIAKEKPLSLFGFEDRKEIGLRYGISTQDGQNGNLFARWQFLRVGSIHLGAYGEVSTKPEAKAMLEAVYRH